MVIAVFLALQAAAPLPVQEPVPADFDLATYRPPRPTGSKSCLPSIGDEVVICGRRARADGYPMEEMARLFERGPMVAELSLGKAVTARAFVERVELLNGVVSNRAMIGLKLPF